MNKSITKTVYSVTRVSLSRSKSSAHQLSVGVSGLSHTAVVRSQTRCQTCESDSISGRFILEQTGVQSPRG